MISIFIWFCITAAFASSPIINMGVTIYGWHIIADLYSAYRAANDFIEAEAQNKLKSMVNLPLPIASEGAEENVHRLPAR
jgi:hypothetical protein